MRVSLAVILCGILFSAAVLAEESKEITPLSEEMLEFLLSDEDDDVIWSILTGEDDFEVIDAELLEKVEDNE